MGGTYKMSFHSWIRWRLKLNLLSFWRRDLAGGGRLMQILGILFGVSHNSSEIGSYGIGCRSTCFFLLGRNESMGDDSVGEAWIEQTCGDQHYVTRLPAGRSPHQFQAEVRRLQFKISQHHQITSCIRWLYLQPCTGLLWSSVKLTRTHRFMRNIKVSEHIIAQ